MSVTPSTETVVYSFIALFVINVVATAVYYTSVK